MFSDRTESMVEDLKERKNSILVLYLWFSPLKFYLKIYTNTYFVYYRSEILILMEKRYMKIIYRIYTKSYVLVLFIYFI